MRTKSAKFFEVGFTYDKMQENGMLKQVTENYSVEALSFTEGEAKITEEMTAYVSGESAVIKMAVAPYKEVWFSDKEEDDKYFKAKLQFITLDEKTAKEKKQNVYYLVQAKNFDTAKKSIEEVMDKSMIDYVIASIQETNILEVYEH